MAKDKRKKYSDPKAIIKEGIRLCGEIYKDIQGWNYFTKKTLGKQLFKSIVSVPSNMSEGHNRSRGNVKKYYSIALGSRAGETNQGSECPFLRP